VIPIHLTDDWNLITRTIVPIIHLPSLGPDVPQATGLGDINPTFFLSPSGSKEFMWGICPTFTFPSATNRLLGMGRYSAGPAAVGLTMQGPWVVGALINNQWSFAGWGRARPRQNLRGGPRLADKLTNANSSRDRPRSETKGSSRTTGCRVGRERRFFSCQVVAGVLAITPARAPLR
jgi:hypothetical protein